MMDVNTWILLALTVGALIFAYARSPSLAGDGLLAGGRLLRGVAPELVLGFALAGLVDVLIPSADLVRWLGAESSDARHPDRLGRRAGHPRRTVRVLPGGRDAVPPGRGARGAA